MMEIRMSQDNKNLPFTPDGDSSVQVIPKVETPKMYQVILVNDDYTPMDFVVLVLKKFFSKKEEDAIKVMLDVHQKGAGTAGVYTLEIAEMKVMQTNQFAQLNQYPLKSILEET
jgi:ATP-dependent Clp protease adaptor protein ClpS